MTRYKFEEGMAQISGFGGTYEESCRAMVITGMKWFDRHKKADPQFRGYKGVYGLITADNLDAKKLSKAVTASVDDYTGAMHHVTIGHILHIHEVGWETYVSERKNMTKERKSERLLEHMITNTSTGMAATKYLKGFLLTPTKAYVEREKRSEGGE